MDMRIPALDIKSLLESDTMESRILVRRLAIQCSPDRAKDSGVVVRSVDLRAVDPLRCVFAAELLRASEC